MKKRLSGHASVERIGSVPSMTLSTMGYIQTNSTTKSKRGRTGIGFNKDGIRLVAIGDSESQKCTSTDFMQKYFKDCDYAINLDGGGSTQYDSPFGRYTSFNGNAFGSCAYG